MFIYVYIYMYIYVYICMIHRYICVYMYIYGGVLCGDVFEVYGKRELFEMCGNFCIRAKQHYILEMCSAKR